MSLWTMPLRDVRFEHIDAFCHTKQTEGMRLDYKLKLEANIIRTVAAFANSYGGLILVGVPADQSTNEPIWPPTDGMPDGPGLTEKVIQWTRENIYPAILPEVSAAIPNGHLTGHSLIVIRVPESREAPHAIENKRSVLIYDRSGNQNDPFRPADIDRIEHLLARRNNGAQQQARHLERMIVRGREQLNSKSTLPIRWASVMPMFGASDVCTAQKCWEVHQHWHTKSRIILGGCAWRGPRRMPGGSMAIGYEQAPQEQPIHVAFTSMTSNGQVFGLSFATECCNQYSESPYGGARQPESIHILYTCCSAFVDEIVSWAARCYGEGGFLQPGTIVIDIGLSRVSKVRMMYDRAVGGPFPDDEFRTQIVVPCHELIESPAKVSDTGLEELQFGFDLSVPKRAPVAYT